MEFMDMPNYPGYTINRRGVVRGPSGFALQVTERGQVRVKKDGRVRLEYVYDLLLDTMLQDVQREADRARAEVIRVQQTADKAIAEQEMMAERLRLARKLNGLLLAMVGRRDPDADLSDLRVTA